MVVSAYNKQKELKMALYQRLVAVTPETVYILEQYGSSTEMISRDLVTGEMSGMYNVIDWEIPRVGQNWSVTLQGGEILETNAVDGVRSEQFNPRSEHWCGPEELDKYASQSIYA
jgi:hypothetical protein